MINPPLLNTTSTPIFAISNLTNNHNNRPVKTNLQPALQDSTPKLPKPLSCNNSISSSNSTHNSSSASHPTNTSSPHLPLLPYHSTNTISSSQKCPRRALETSSLRSARCAQRRQQCVI